MFGPQVYDVTHFAKIHPGGPGRIQMAAGSDLQKYFDVARAGSWDGREVSEWCCNREIVSFDIHAIQCYTLL